MTFGAEGKSGIYVVANGRSERDCARLVTSIRESGCGLPIVLIPFNDDPIRCPKVLDEVTVMQPDAFPDEAHRFVEELSTLLNCPQGFLRRFYAFFGPFDQFLYTDNDIIALCDWQELIDRLGDSDLLHADEEYVTGGRFNFRDPDRVKQSFGEHALEQVITAGHFVARRSPKLVDDMREALRWMEANKASCILHDQTLMHIAVLIGGWDCINLCKPPHDWMSSWAGDYESPLTLIQAGQSGRRISHLHYSGFGEHSFSRAVDTLRLSHLPDRRRNRVLAGELVYLIAGGRWVEWKWKRAKQKFMIGRN